MEGAGVGVAVLGKAGQEEKTLNLSAEGSVRVGMGGAHPDLIPDLESECRGSDPSPNPS